MKLVAINEYGLAQWLEYVRAKVVLVAKGPTPDLPKGWTDYSLILTSKVGSADCGVASFSEPLAPPSVTALVADFITRAQDPQEPDDAAWACAVLELALSRQAAKEFVLYFAWSDEA